VASPGDPRIERYAKLLVERCLDVQPGWEVLIRSTPLARPLLDELQRQIARRGAHPVMRVSWSSLWPVDNAWVTAAPEELLSSLPDIDRYACERMDARMTVDAPENTRAEADVPAERLALANTAAQIFFRRTMA
jgi:aminopeptidase